MGYTHGRFSGVNPKILCSRIECHTFDASHANKINTSILCFRLRIKIIGISLQTSDPSFASTGVRKKQFGGIYLLFIIMFPPVGRRRKNLTETWLKAFLPVTIAG